MRADVGDMVRDSCTFRRVSDGDVADPTTVTVTVTEPDGTATDYVYDTDEEVVRDSEGAYHIDITIDAVGDWKTKWIGEGDVVAGTEVFLIDVKG